MAHEYIFFDEALRDRFQQDVLAQGLSCTVRADRMEGWVVSLPEELPDLALQAAEARYDALMDTQRELADAQDGVEARDLMGITVTLPDGQECLVRIPAVYGRRLVAQFSAQELHELVSVIARGVVNPQDGPLCRQC